MAVQFLIAAISHIQFPLPRYLLLFAIAVGFVRWNLVMMYTSLFHMLLYVCFWLSFVKM